MNDAATHVRVIQETAAYWRVVFDYPPFNIVDATIFEGLQNVLARMDASPSEHWDVIQDEATQAESKSGLPMFGEKFTK